MSRRRGFGGRLDWFLLFAVCFGALTIGAFAGGAADIGLLAAVITAFALRGAHRVWRAKTR